MRCSWKLALLLPAIALGGCAVGIARIHAPERSPVRSAPPLTRRVTFDVCSSPREAGAERIREELSRAGIEADLVSPPGASARFTVTLRERRYEMGWSMFLSMFTFSIIPGYLAERYDIEVDIASRDAAKGDMREHLVYERGVDAFVWAPFIVHPDFIGSVNGAWESEKYKRIYENVQAAGFAQAVQRLADDLRARLGREGPGSPSSEVAGVSCPIESRNPPESDGETSQTAPVK